MKKYAEDLIKDYEEYTKSSMKGLSEFINKTERYSRGTCSNEAKMAFTNASAELVELYRKMAHVEAELKVLINDDLVIELRDKE